MSTNLRSSSFQEASHSTHCVLLRKPRHDATNSLADATQPRVYYQGYCFHACYFCLAKPDSFEPSSISFTRVLKYSVVFLVYLLSFQMQ